MKGPQSVARQQSLYRRMLVLYPRSFRETYAEPMLQLFGDCLRESGPRIWLSTISDVLRTAPTQRTEEIVKRLSPGVRIVSLALVVLGAAVVGVGLGVGAVPVVAVLVVALVLSQRRLFAAMPRGERAPLRHALVQTWWAPLAGLLGVALVVMGIGTVFEAHNWGGRIVGSAALLAFGGAMLLGLMRRPFGRETGNAMILIATIPAFLFFWVIVPTLVAIVIWVGVLTSGFSDRQPVLPAG